MKSIAIPAQDTTRRRMTALGVFVRPQPLPGWR